jgi:ATP-dependent RNA helicase DeaD
MATFKELPLSQGLRDILEKQGFTVPTEIQAKAIPLLVSSKKIDFHGQAQTGTGKTLAFGIPLFERINQQGKVTQALIVAPTRELAVQINESLEKIASHLGISIAVIYGGVSLEEQIRKLKRGVQIVVGTPGRINDHIRRKTLDLRTVETLVLDEADIMLDMGFKDEIDALLEQLPPDRQIWLFSATVKAGISQIMKKHMRNTVSVLVSSAAVATSRTKQFYCIVPARSRVHAITRFIQSVGDFYGFIFCQTKILASEVADELTKRGYNVAALHGDLSQQQRNRVIRNFRKGETTILVATDVAARGIDIPDITHVINYSIPDDLESYVHRVGRTGRAGKEGVAITFINRAEQRTLKQIEKRFGTLIEPIDVPSAEEVIHKRLLEVPAYFEKSGQVPQQAALAKLVDSVPAGKLKEVVVRLLYEKFLEKLDLEEIPYTHVEEPQDQYQEIYINKGDEDGITSEDVRAYILQAPTVKPDQIQKIRVIRKRSFIRLSSECSPDLVRSLYGKKIHGQPVVVNVQCLVNEHGQEWRQRERNRRKKIHRRVR